MPFCPTCGCSVESASFCLSCGTILKAAYPYEPIQLSMKKKGDVLEGRPREVILVDKEGVGLQSIIKRALRLEEAPVQARSRKDELEAKVRDLEAEIWRLLGETEGLKKSSVRIQQLEGEVMELAAGKAELEEEIRVLEIERDELKKEVEELEEKVAITGLEGRIAELQAEIRELGEKKKQLEEKTLLPEASPAT